MNMLANQQGYRRLDAMFPAFFGGKHDHNKDFGFPVNPGFNEFFAAYDRQGLGFAAVEKTAAKTWQDFPFLQEKQRDGSEKGSAKETRWERNIRQRFDDLRVWQRLKEADVRGMVGAYAGVILRLGDGQPFDKAVKRVRGGLDGLIELLPTWEAQLTVAEWDSDQTSAAYGQPVMYQFNEAAVGQTQNPRMLRIHPDRVLIWSKDGSVNGRSALKSGLNDLLTVEKIIGAGGEGFWKNAKSAPVLEIDKDAKLDAMAKAMGLKVDEIADAMNEQVEAYQKGFDQLLMLQGMQAKQLQVNLPSPEHFFLTAVNSFAASFQMPTKILIGNQTGERASTEDSQEWAQTCMGRRADHVRPNIMALVQRLERVGILPERDWHLDWADLTEASMGEKIDRVVKMTTANKNNPGEIIFTSDDMRSVVGMEPLAPEEKAKAAPPAPTDDPVAPATEGDDTPDPQAEPAANRLVLPIRI